ncbi:MAG: N-acetylmuramic acid 6-phosphate etherase [Clostridiales bacterium]|nr:N-acetylmuramic acid 6-phosphate etherase [Clostridiales bacterium]
MKKLDRGVIVSFFNNPFKSDVLSLLGKKAQDGGAVGLIVESNDISAVSSLDIPIIGYTLKNGCITHDVDCAKEVIANGADVVAVGISPNIDSVVAYVHSCEKTAIAVLDANSIQSVKIAEKSGVDMLCMDLLSEEFEGDKNAINEKIKTVQESSSIPTLACGVFEKAEDVSAFLRQGSYGVVVGNPLLNLKTAVNNYAKQAKAGIDKIENPPSTEDRNERSLDIDKLSTLGILSKINAEDASVAREVEFALPSIAKIVDAIYERYQKGGRILYCGAGTSGRLAVVDSAECPPTYGVEHGRVVATMAGGKDAVFKASENKEDSYESGYESAKELGVNVNDVAIGISANGNAQFCLGFMAYAKEQGAKTVAIVNNVKTKMSDFADLSAHLLTGAEVVKGSTRMKAATAQKMTINMISTALFIKCGCVISNLMVNINPNNIKLKNRAVNMLSALCKKDESECRALLENNSWSIRKCLEITGIKE